VGNLEKGDYTIASFNVESTQAQGGNAGTQSGSTKSSVSAGNSTAASISGDPLKVQIGYTDAKGDRLTVDKEVKLDRTSNNMTSQGGAVGQRSSGISSYLLYIVVIVMVGGVFAYRNKIQEAIRVRKEKKSGISKSEDQNN
jgi:hypothetical protein